jgi:EF-P beta-lysylation protein EpmB
MKKDNWQNIFKTNYRSLHKLAAFLKLDEEKLSQIPDDKLSFPLNLPVRLANKIEKNNLYDPILLQFLPLKDEFFHKQGFDIDPVCEKSFLKTPKLLQKYYGRALLLTTPSCCMHCRFCFRQNFSYPTDSISFDEEINIIKQDTTIKEIILSGGDPLTLSNKMLASLLSHIDRIDHIKRIRIHSRMIIGIPERIDEELLALLSSIKKQLIIITHINHPNELDNDIFFYIKKLQLIGIPIFNQTVLLHNVNDTDTILLDLCNTLADRGIIPYYIHQLDKVKGTHNFEVTLAKGKQLYLYLEKKLSGYALPKYVQEVPGKYSKTKLI